MINDSEYYFDINPSQDKYRFIINYRLPGKLNYFPNTGIGTVGKKLKELESRILILTGDLPKEEIIIKSRELAKTTLTRLCNMLNKERKEEIFKLTA